MQLLLNIHLYYKPYTICSITGDGIYIPDTEVCKQLRLESANCSDGDRNTSVKKGRKKHKISSNALHLQHFLKECSNSDEYRYILLRKFGDQCEYPSSLKLSLKPPDKEIIDYAWNDRILKTVWSRVEVENAFSWLSTLGGAYSALGDYFDNCAEEAARISVRQYKLSVLLGDPSLAARSMLYSAIADAQKADLKKARRTVRLVAQFAKLTKDRRLMRMCHGVWAKLKYMRSQMKSLTISEDGDKVTSKM